MNRATVYFLIGPTAVGKTEAALVMAPRMQAEVISADSMQVYRGADILSAKPAPSELARVRHHLVDLLDPREGWNVADFRRQALGAIRDVVSRGKRPLVVGGSGLYIRTLIRGIFEGPGEDLALRKRLKLVGARGGTQALHARLGTVDPETARRVGGGDARRMIRALEVYESSRVPISALKPKRTGLAEQYEIRLAGLVQIRPRLYRRAEERVDRMFDEGLVEEVRRLQERGVGPTLEQCIGIKEVRSHLKGELSLDEARDRMKQGTRRLIKKQFTWFRREDKVEWFRIGRGASFDRLRASPSPERSRGKYRSAGEAAQGILRHWGL